MGLLDPFSPPKKTDGSFGDLVYRRGAWHGELSIGELHHENIPVEIQTSKDSDLSAFRAILACLRENIRQIKNDIADEAFKTFDMYVREDRKAGNFTDAEYARYPSVTSAADIWRVLKPFRLTLTDNSDEYNMIVWLHVDWPNPHYFVVFLNDARVCVLDVDG